ncbi:MAG: tyrosine-type recombinase/integrase [Chloroflexi bacterium]|nr:tyrosine-type recombinase/integrase [Chloroflexota bacterium]
MNASLALQPTVLALPVFQTIDEAQLTPAILDRFQIWLLDGGYAQTTVPIYVAKAGWLLSLLARPLTIDTSPDAVINQLRSIIDERSELSLSTKHSHYDVLKKLREFLHFERGSAPPSADPLALPSRLAELPEWLREPLGRHLRLQQRNWLAATVRHHTQSLFYRLRRLCEFFIQQYGWTEWTQLSVRWIDAYIETCLRREMSPTTINCVLFAFQGFCRFLCEEGYAVPSMMMHIQPLNVPQHLPRPLADDQVRQLERTIQNSDRQQANRDLAWFYLLWHCGLRVSEVQQLTVNDLDLSGHKLWVRMGKGRRDRLVYVSDTAVQALQHHLNTRPDRDAIHVFTRHRRPISTRMIQRRLSAYGRQAGIAVSPHRLRHTFASQMLAAGMPVTSLQRYLGHDNISITMLYAKVSDPMLQHDYYRGITTLDPDSVKFSAEKNSSLREELSQLVAELGTLDQSSDRYTVILKQIQRLLSESEGGAASNR